VAEIDARIGQLTRMRQALVEVMAADCDSLTNCSCGHGRPPSWAAGEAPG
jgi:hypothetical protein